MITLDGAEGDKTVKVCVVEDDDDLRNHFKTSIRADTGLTLSWHASSVTDGLQLAKNFLPDVALIDLGLPDGDGSELITYLKSQSLTKVLVITVFGDRLTVQRAIESGADGYLVKDSHPERITSAIKDVARGGAPVSASVTPHLVSLARKEGFRGPVTSEESRAAPPLTVREIELLELFAKGLSYKEAAECLGLSRHTVADYVKSVYRKLSVNSRSEAVFEAVHYNLISLSNHN